MLVEANQRIYGGTGGTGGTQHTGTQGVGLLNRALPAHVESKPIKNNPGNFLLLLLFSAVNSTYSMMGT